MTKLTAKKLRAVDWGKVLAWETEGRHTRIYRNPEYPGITRVVQDLIAPYFRFQYRDYTNVEEVVRAYNKAYQGTGRQIPGSVDSIRARKGSLR